MKWSNQCSAAAHLQGMHGGEEMVGHDWLVLQAALNGTLSHGESRCCKL